MALTLIKQQNLIPLWESAGFILHVVQRNFTFYGTGDPLPSILFFQPTQMAIKLETGFLKDNIRNAYLNRSQRESKDLFLNDYSNSDIVLISLEFGNGLKGFSPIKKFNDDANSIIYEELTE